MILHTLGAILFFGMLWAMLQYEGTPEDVHADDDPTTALTKTPRSGVIPAARVPALAALRAGRQGCGPG
jgi:hypothetical protein